MVPLLELGAGFDPQYTGKENIYLYGAMLGYTKKFIDSKYDEIVEFSELQKFMDVPGEKLFLRYEIQTWLFHCHSSRTEDPDLDEVLSVGDSQVP